MKLILTHHDKTRLRFMTRGRLSTSFLKWALAFIRTMLPISQLLHRVYHSLKFEAALAWRRNADDINKGRGGDCCIIRSIVERKQRRAKR